MEVHFYVKNFLYRLPLVADEELFAKGFHDSMLPDF